jgi:hypothetical protein
MADEKRQRSPLVNALWGAGIVSPELSAVQYRRVRWSLAAIAVAVATGVGVLAGMLDGWVAGLTSSAVTVTVVMTISAWVVRDYAPSRDSQ